MGWKVERQVGPFWTSFGGIFMTTSPAANLPGGIDDPGPSVLVCTACGTADDLVIEAIEAIIPAVPGFVCLEYSCSACGCFYGHDASVQQVATVLNAGATAPGVLHFGRYFIHCGEPMEDIGEGVVRLGPPAGSRGGPAGSRGGPSATISMRTRLLRCHCGFQLDVPL